MTLAEQDLDRLLTPRERAKGVMADADKATQGDVVRIRWRDSCRIMIGWSSIDEYVHELDENLKSLCETVGFYMGRNGGFVLVVLNYDAGKSSITDAMAIPHETIRSFEILAEGASLDREPTA